MLSFLRANAITPQVNGMPCRSLADFDAAERSRAEREQTVAQARAAAGEQALSHRREEERRNVEFAVLAERENGMALAMLLLVVALGAGGAAYVLHEHGDRQKLKLAGAAGLLALGGALLAWLLRPGFDEVEGRLEDLLHASCVKGLHLSYFWDRSSATNSSRVASGRRCTWRGPSQHSRRQVRTASFVSRTSRLW